MLYQIFYDAKSKRAVRATEVVRPFGVFAARALDRDPGAVYDDDLEPNLTEHNTLCEWRAMYYVWRHHRSSWVGFTSWKHDAKGFSPRLRDLTADHIVRELEIRPIVGFGVRPLRALMVLNMRIAKRLSDDEKARVPTTPTLPNQFLQWGILNRQNDSRGLPQSDYHQPSYWNEVLRLHRDVYGVEIDRHWGALASMHGLHTWCNAFVARWEYFDDYMRHATPIVMALLDRFGSHPNALELSYCCERLIILHNYVRLGVPAIETASAQARN